MRKCRNWVLSAALMAACPGLALAGPFDSNPLKSGGSASARRTNQQVANDIAAALKQARLEGRDIEIEYRNGVATLTGKIADGRQKAAAAAAVKTVPEVKSVANQLEVQSDADETPFGVQSAGFQGPRGNVQQVGLNLPENAASAEKATRASSTRPTNQQMAQKIADSLQAAGVSGQNLEIRYSDGKALLSGGVGSNTVKQRAEQAARGVPGVRAVDNRLAISDFEDEPAPRPARKNSQLVNTAYQAEPGAAPDAPGAAPAPGGQPAPGVGPGPGPGPNGMPPGVGGPGFAPPPGYGAPGGYGPPGGYGHPGAAGAPGVVDNPYLPNYSWPTYGAYPNSANISYPKQYSASAWPYIGPFYPYPQVPLGWRAATLEWDDGYWNLNFRSRTDKWWWFMNPKNW